MLEQLPFLLGQLFPILISLGIFSLMEKHNRKNLTQAPLLEELIIGSALFGLLGMVGCAIIYLIRYRIYKWRQFDQSETKFSASLPDVGIA